MSRRGLPIPFASLHGDAVGRAKGELMSMSMFQSTLPAWAGRARDGHPRHREYLRYDSANFMQHIGGLSYLT